MNELVDKIRQAMEERTSEELISILRNHDEEEWRPEAFEAVALVLEARGISPEEIASLGPEGSDVVESEPTVTVGNFFSPAEAHVSRLALEEAGIRAWVVDELGGTIYGVGIGTRLQVRAADQAAALGILSTAPTPPAELPPDLAEPPCPACGSRNVVPEAWVNDKKAVPAASLSRKRREWHYVCEDCDEAWPLDDAAEQDDAPDEGHEEGPQ